MRARLLLNLALAALVVALAGVVVLGPGSGDPRPERTLSDLDPDAVRLVRIEPAGREPFTLERDGDAWRLATEPRLPADPFRVRALLGVLGATSHSGFRAAGNDLARFGLDPARVRLLVDGRELAFGDTDAIDGRRYVLYDGEVHLVDDAQYPHLSARAENFVHPSPLGPGARPIDITVPGLRVRRTSGGWQTEPQRSDLGADDLETLADAWASSRALRVSAYAQDGEWSEQATIVLDGDDAPIDIAVWRAGHEVILGRPELGVQWHFVRRVGERLLADR